MTTKINSMWLSDKLKFGQSIGRHSVQLRGKALAICPCLSAAFSHESKFYEQDVEHFRRDRNTKCEGLN